MKLGRLVAVVIVALGSELVIVAQDKILPKKGHAQNASVKLKAAHRKPNVNLLPDKIVEELKVNKIFARNVVVAIYEILSAGKFPKNESLRTELFEFIMKSYGRTPEKIKLPLKRLTKVKRQLDYQKRRNKLDQRKKVAAPENNFLKLAHALQIYNESLDGVDVLYAGYKGILTKQGTIEEQRRSVLELKKNWYSYEAAVLQLNDTLKLLNIPGTFKIDERKRRSMRGLFYIYEDTL